MLHTGRGGSCGAEPAPPQVCEFWSFPLLEILRVVVGLPLLLRVCCTPTSAPGPMQELIPSELRGEIGAASPAPPDSLKWGYGAQPVVQPVLWLQVPTPTTCMYSIISTGTPPLQPPMCFPPQLSAAPDSSDLEGVHSSVLVLHSIIGPGDMTLSPKPRDEHAQHSAGELAFEFAQYPNILCECDCLHHVLQSLTGAMQISQPS